MCLLTSLSARADVDFYRDVYPILKANCLSCHNKTITEAGLNLESPETIRGGGDSGPAMVPGKSIASLIVHAATQTGDVVMPPENNKAGAVKLTPAEMGLLVAWIDEGAKSSVRQTEQIVWQPLPAGIHPIYTVAVTRDARWAACGRANQLFLYDLATRRLQTRLVDPSLLPAKGALSGGTAHRDLVQSIAFSPDGSRMASGSFREVKIWKQAAAVTPRTSPLLPDATMSALTPDGRLFIAADSEGTLHVLDAVTGSTLRVIPDVKPAAKSVLCVSPDSASIAVCTAGATIGIWNLTTGERTGTIADPHGARAFVWSRDGGAIVIAGDDNVVRIWKTSATDSATPRELSGAKAPITTLVTAVNPDRVIAAGEDGNSHVWNLEDGKLLQTVKIPSASALAVSRDGKILAAGSPPGQVRLFDLATGQQIVELTGDADSQARQAGLSWDLGARQLDAAYHKKELARIAAENKVLEEVLKKARETIATVEKTLPEKEKAAATAAEAKQSAQTAVDALATQLAAMPEAALDKQHKEALKKLESATTQAAVAEAYLTSARHHIQDARGEEQSATAAQVRNAESIKAETEAVAASQTAIDQVQASLTALKKEISERKLRPLAVCFSADGATIAAAYDNGELRVWGIPSATPLLHIPGSGPATSANIVSPRDGLFVSRLADGSLIEINTTPNWELERVIGGDSAAPVFADRVNALRFSPDGRTLAVGSGEPSRSGDVSLWEVESGSQIANWTDRHRDAVLGLDFSPDGRLLASGAADKMAVVTDIATGRQMHAFEGHTHHVMGVSFRPDGRMLATAGADGVVLVWDMLLGERKKKIEGWTKEVTSLQFMGPGANVLTSAGDQRIRIVTDEGGEVRSMAKLPEFMQSAASDALGQIIVGGGEDGVLRVWDGTNGKELAVFAAP
ncbi:c-type cytochrome domain-containing protein [Planctomicrobium piriforme]|uniref:c-type cytochrome domain-containing protein n=1 Tax=Planctomicrobium piriforme TaxID=1576369 RepID=UPI0015871D14|nr:c-type cytochrome domain-containing protein [Planctomicrobium piriforme]